MARPAFPRSPQRHETKANEILRRHALHTGDAVTLPIPIEQIVEATYGLTVIYDEIDEPDNAVILGALSPSHRLITLNTRHEDLFAEVLGPERFTLAHELGHWVYDAENPDQGTLDFAPPPDEFCYDRHRSLHLPDSVEIREINANHLAAALLLPAHLIRDVDLATVFADFRGTARRWKVSQQALQIRLERLGLLTPTQAEHLNLHD